MAYQDTDLGVVLQAFVDKINAAGLGFTERSCFIALRRPTTPPPNPGNADNLFVACYPDGGDLSALVAGGGINQTSDSTTIAVEIFSAMLLDSAGRDGIAMTQASRSCLKMARKILKALTGQMLQVTVNGTPTDILRQPLLPENRGAPEREDEILGSVVLSFRVIFDWDLVTA